MLCNAEEKRGGGGGGGGGGEGGENIGIPLPIANFLLKSSSGVNNNNILVSQSNCNCKAGGIDEGEWRKFQKEG